jgi:hypothetical protein
MKAEIVSLVIESCCPGEMAPDAGCRLITSRPSAVRFDWLSVTFTWTLPGMVRRAPRLRPRLTRDGRVRASVQDRAVPRRAFAC